MDERERGRATLRGLTIAAAIGSIAVIAWLVGSVRAGATRQVARARLWPRHDGSVQSFGEVWDIPSSPTSPHANPTSVVPSQGG